jgi:acetoacetyl-CoA synthetase
MTTSAADTPIWSPTAAHIANSNVTAFMRYLERQGAGGPFADYESFAEWSRQNTETFFVGLWDFAGIVSETRGGRVLADGGKMPGAKWFPDAKLNFAENLLRRRDDAPALVFRGEDKVRRELSFKQLYNQVSQLAQALKADGVKAGDRVVGFMPNMNETIVAMLAATSLGAVWSSCSPDFGVKGVMDRFGQVQPTVLITANGYYYGGKEFDSLARIKEIAPQIPSIKRIVVVPYTKDAASLDGLPNAMHYGDYLGRFQPGEIAFTRMPFNSPLYIMYSSGTTGMPKCIIHGVGGTLLQQVKEQLFHTDLKRGDRVYYFTTCGWMMWNWLASSLASEATLMLYDGSPFHPDGYTLFDYAAAERFTQLGVSAKFIQGVEKAAVVPNARYEFPALRAVLSTGSVLLPEGFDYVYAHLKQDVCLSSVSGGTDIISCFIGGNPNGPVYRGELQASGLGMATEVFDAAGHPVRGEKGELVCTRAFPSMPLGFWGDDGDVKYRAAYFERFPGVWAHGDFAEITAHDGFVIYGRSDATLNPGGVRIGTAEIYRQVETLPEVVESVAIGQDWDGDVRVVLFVVLRPGATLDAALEARLRQQIRAGASPRHVPARIVQVTDIPRTRSGKLTELAIRDIVHGQAIKNAEALANPEALEQFRNRPELTR